MVNPFLNGKNKRKVFMLEQKLRELFKKNGGVIRCSTLQSSNRVTFKVIKDGTGFVCDRGAAIYPFNKMDDLESEIKTIAKYSKDGKVYYGANLARNGLKLGDDPWFETTLDGILALRVFEIEYGKSVYGGSTYIAALLQQVGFAVMHRKDLIDAFITLTGRF